MLTYVMGVIGGGVGQFVHIAVGAYTSSREIVRVGPVNTRSHSHTVVLPDTFTRRSRASVRRHMTGTFVGGHV